MSIQILEFTRSRVRALWHGHEVLVSGEMTLEPFGFVVFDGLPLRIEGGAELDDDTRTKFLADLRHEFVSKDRELQLASDERQPFPRHIVWPAGTTSMDRCPD
jgi:hypothetical protein